MLTILLFVYQYLDIIIIIIIIEGLFSACAIITVELLFYSIIVFFE